MKRYAAFLRGVSPMNANMARLRACLETSGFGNVKTVLTSGNVVLDARDDDDEVVARKVERAMKKHLGYEFMTIVRSVDALNALIASNPFARFRLSSEAKPIVTFLRDVPSTKHALPIEKDGARILAVADRAVLSAYVPHPRAAAFMVLIEKTFGKGVTTRTWATVTKVASK